MSRCVIINNVTLEENINKIILDLGFSEFDILKYDKNGYKIQFPSNKIALEFLKKTKDTKYNVVLCKTKIKLCSDVNCLLPYYMDYFDKKKNFVLNPPENISEFFIKKNIKFIECKFFKCQKCKFDSHHLNDNKTCLFVHIPYDNI